MSEDLNDKEITENIIIDEQSYDTNTHLDNSQLTSETSNTVATSNKNDTVANNYIIDTNHKIEELSNNFATAYECKIIKGMNATHNYYALVLSNNFSARNNLIDFLIEEHIKGFPVITACESTYLTQLGARHTVIIATKPMGQTIRNYIAQNGVFNERNILPILINIVKNLLLLEKNNIMHGSINPDNIYIHDDNIDIREAISNFYGYYQPALYEPVERMYMNNFAKGEDVSTADSYALGVLIYFMLTGKEVDREMDARTLCIQRLTLGSYQVITQNANFDNFFQTIFKGLLSDRQKERWSLNKLFEYITGSKKFTASSGPLYDNTNRVYIFNDHKYDNIAILTYDIWQNWFSYKKILNDENFSVWLERGVGDVGLAENVNYLIKNIRFNRTNPQLAEDEAMTKIMAIIDPVMPIRYLSIAFSFSAVGRMLAFGIAMNHSEVINLLAKIFQFSNFKMLEVSDNASRHNRQNIFTSLEKCKLFLNNTLLGFGIERCLYHLNPDLPCQSQLVIKYAVTNTSDLMRIIENDIAPNSQIIIDRHIAAFIAHRLNVDHEFKIKVAEIYAEFADKALHSLTLFAVTQKYAKLKLPNIATKYANSLTHIIDLFYSKSTRIILSKEIEKIAKQGDLFLMLQVITDPQLIEKDRSGLTEATMSFASIDKDVGKLAHKRSYFEIGYQYGLHLSGVISYLICGIYLLILTIIG